MKHSLFNYSVIDRYLDCLQFFHFTNNVAMQISLVHKSLWHVLESQKRNCWTKDIFILKFDRHYPLECLSIYTIANNFWGVPCPHTVTLHIIPLKIVQSNGWIMISCFTLYFSDYQWIWTSFHIFIGHFYFFFRIRNFPICSSTWQSCLPFSNRFM